MAALPEAGAGGTASSCPAWFLLPEQGNRREQAPVVSPFLPVVFLRFCSRLGLGIKGIKHSLKSAQGCGNLGWEDGSKEG